jgi:hypothetical protein
MWFAAGVAASIALGMTVYIVWGGGAEALGLVGAPVDKTANLDPRNRRDVHLLVLHS